jgi:hypothetical protein
LCPRILQSFFDSRLIFHPAFFNIFKHYGVDRIRSTVTFFSGGLLSLFERRRIYASGQLIPCFAMLCMRLLQGNIRVSSMKTLINCLCGRIAKFSAAARRSYFHICIGFVRLPVSADWQAQYPAQTINQHFPSKNRRFCG